MPISDAETWQWPKDASINVIAVALSIDDARRTTAHQLSDENGSVWLDETRTKCAELVGEQFSESLVILTSYDDNDHNKISPLVSMNQQILLTLLGFLIGAIAVIIFFSCYM